MTRKDLLQSWDDAQMEDVKSAISKFFGMPYEYLYMRLGLAYTSTSAFAALWVCNMEQPMPKNEKFHIRGFALNTDNQVVAYCEDKEENELLHIITE